LGRLVKLFKLAFAFVGMKKLFFALLFGFLLVSSVYAGSLESNVSKIKEFTEKDKWEFIGAQWKEFLLKNKVIAGADLFFTDINIVFVIFLGMNWSLSLQMLFAVMFFAFTFISLISYSKLKFKNGWNVLLVSLGVTVIIAQARIFSYLSAGAVKIILYKSGAVWSSVMFIVIMGALFAYLILNREISKSLKKAKEKREKEELKRKVKKTEEFQENIVRISKHVEE